MSEMKFEKSLFLKEMSIVSNKILENYTVEEAWEAYDHHNIALQGAWYRGLIDKETMQKSISMFVDAAAELEKQSKGDSDWLYGYFYRPL